MVFFFFYMIEHHLCSGPPSLARGTMSATIGSSVVMVSSAEGASKGSALCDVRDDNCRKK